MVSFMQTFTLLVVFIQATIGQLLVPDTSNNCTAELWEFCDQFLLNGGLQCHRNAQRICYHEHEEMNNQEYCSQNATYNCRTFILRYGYACNATLCVSSSNII